MDITTYIPKGKENAISRKALIELTGLPDRKVRECISQARRETVIINLQNGKDIINRQTKRKLKGISIKKWQG